MTASDLAGQPCTLLSWDTEFWGFPIARLNTTALTESVVREADAWCSEHGIRCLYFMASGSCPRTLALADEHGFRFIDVRVELSLSAPDKKAAPKVPVEVRVRPAGAPDLPALRLLAAESHRDTRFFKDDRFDTSRSADLYSTWIARDFSRHAVLVCESMAMPSRPCGYISCERDKEKGEGRIGLIAVAAGSKGLGFGEALVTRALQQFADADLHAVRVVTQGTNVAALRLYERCGFLTSHVGVWFHKWFG